MHKVENLHLVLQQQGQQKKIIIKIKVKHQNIFSPSSINVTKVFLLTKKEETDAVKDGIYGM